MDYQRQLLQAVTTDFSVKNRYQKIIVALFSILWIELCYLCMIGSFVFMNPLFECQGEPSTEIVACNQMSQCIITNSYTATFHAGLYCDREEERETIQSAYSLGVVIGMFLIPLFSDWKGRRLAIILSTLACFVGALFLTIGVYMNSVFLMIFGQIIIGGFLSGIIVLTYIITAQFCSDSLRQFSILLYNGIWGFSQASFILIYYFMPQWYNFLFILVLIPLLGFVILLYFLILQTPLFCIFNLRNSHQYQNVVRELALINDPTNQLLDQTIKTGNAILKLQQQQLQNSDKKSIKEILIELLTTKKYLKSIILLVLIYSGFNFSYFGAQMCLERTGLNFGVTMVMIGLSEFAANVTCGYFIHLIPRKIGLLGTLAVGSALGLLFLIPSIHHNETVQTFIVPFYRVCSVTFFAFVVMLQTQSFDSSVKSTAIGLVSSLGKLVNMFIPFLVGSMNDRGIHPLVASSILFFAFSFVPTLLIKQTKSMKPLQKEDDNEQNRVINQENALNSNLINKEID